MTGSGVLHEPIRYIGGASEPQFENGWTNWGNLSLPAGFYKSADGHVHLRGMITGGFVAANAFILPAGYFASGNMYFATQQVGGFGIILVGAFGGVQPTIGGNGNYSLDGISFLPV